MKRLSKKEENIMNLFWANGPMTVSEMRELFTEPKPHVNTISTQIRILEKNGYIDHEKEGSGFRYFALVSREEYSNKSIGSIVSKCFANSYIEAVSALVKDEKISVDELEELIRSIGSKK
jgi:BlaI family transcriptional regulator, penicillinase repressor